jgi:hypothetical protein
MCGRPNGERVVNHPRGPDAPIAVRVAFDAREHRLLSFTKPKTSVRPELVEGFARGFDKLSPNGWVSCHW